MSINSMFQKKTKQLSWTTQNHLFWFPNNIFNETWWFPLQVLPGDNAVGSGGEEAVALQVDFGILGPQGLVS